MRTVVLALAVAVVGVLGVLVAVSPVPGPGRAEAGASPTALGVSTPSSAPGRPAEPTPSAAESTPAPGPPTRSDVFVSAPQDVIGEVKERAAAFVQAVGTWTEATAAGPSARVTAAGYPAELTAMAGALVQGPASRATTTIVYPQYGGLTADSASVMVLARQQLLGGPVRNRDVLLDIRLRRAGDGTWNVTSAVDPPRPSIAPRRNGGPTALGRAVLDNPRLDISAPARADIAEERVGDPILAVLDRLSRSYSLQVQVLTSGHPGTVFPTTRLSNHAVGRAVDVRAVDGRRVIDIPRDDPVLSAFAAAAGRAGATEVGAPIQVPGTGFFTDEVHQDHFHLGITPTKAPAAAG